VASFADAAVVGSALAELIEGHADRGSLAVRIEGFVRELKDAMEAARGGRSGGAPRAADA
jgi:tryptophan synthase alpha subunit